MPVKLSGATPMTVNSTPLSCTFCPRIDGSDAELLFPEAVADHDHRVAAGDFVLLRQEGAAKCGLNAHDLEEVAADEQAERQPRQRLARRRRGPR